MDFALVLLVKKLCGIESVNFAQFLSCNLMPLLFCADLTFGKSHCLLPQTVHVYQDKIKNAQFFEVKKEISLLKYTSVMHNRWLLNWPVSRDTYTRHL